METHFYQQKKKTEEMLGMTKIHIRKVSQNCEIKFKYIYITNQDYDQFKDMREIKIIK